MIARMIGAGKPKTSLSTLMTIVFFSRRRLSGTVKKLMKCFSPTQSLPQMPFEML